VRAPVKSAGVVVGRVADIRFDPETYEAVVTFNIDGRYRFPKDTFALILTAGLLGEQYIGSIRAVTRRCSRPASDRQDAVGGGAGKADQSVHVQQGVRRTERQIE
jgi:hypothetical protein